MGFTDDPWKSLRISSKNDPERSMQQVILRRTLQREIKRRSATGEDDMAFFDHKRAAQLSWGSAGCRSAEISRDDPRWSRYWETSHQQKSELSRSSATWSGICSSHVHITHPLEISTTMTEGGGDLNLRQRPWKNGRRELGTFLFSPLVNVYIAIENHHFLWANQRTFYGHSQ